MLVSTCISIANKTLITKPNKFQTMSQKREIKLSATNINVAETTSPSLKLTTVGKIHHNLTNILYSASLQDRLVTDYQSLLTELDEAVNIMKEIIMGFKFKGDDDQVQELIMIDTIQRLGIDHHFQNEIHDVLKRHYTKYYVVGEVGDDLHEVSLRFRLLRQEGYNVAAIGTFARFKDDNGKFNSTRGSDIKGLISLFEASHLSIQGDDILDEAGEFSKNMLELYSKSNDHQLLEAKNIRTTLGSPCQRSFPRLMAKNFLYNLETYLQFQHGVKAPNDWTNIICDVAKKDLNMAQIIHQGEINHVLRWWKELHLAEELKLARDQPVKWYMWSLVAFPNARIMREERLQLTKQISFIYIMDDIFDVYGTLEDLTLFTEAVNRWDYGEQTLPEYMNMFLRAFYETTNEISDQIYAKHGWNPKQSIQKVWVELCNAFLMEAKWLASGHSPNSEEYLKNGLISSGSYVVVIILFCLTGQKISHDDVCWLNNFQSMVTSTATILRLWDDLGSAKDEDQNGRDGSFIDFYVNEHKGCSIERARDVVNQRILDAWKQLNEECMISSSIPAYLKSCLNLAKMVPMMYNYDDNQRLHDLERYMKSFLYERIV